MLKIHFSDRFSVGLAVLGLGEHAVHDGEDAGRDWRSGLLQDTALESDTQIETWAGGVRLYMT